MLTEIPRDCDERLDVAAVTGFTVEPSPELNLGPVVGLYI